MSLAICSADRAPYSYRYSREPALLSHFSLHRQHTPSYTTSGPQQISFASWNCATIQETLTLLSYRLLMLHLAMNPQTIVTGKPAVRTETTPSRRLTSRVPAPEDVWVFWNCNGQEDISRVRDMSMGGLFIETPQPRAAGVLTKLHFLVQEGQIRADAVVRHAKSGVGLGLRFTAMSEPDRPKLAALLARVRRTQPSHGKP